MTTSNRPFTPASFYEFLAEGKLMASHCLECGALHLPPRPVCPYCRGSHVDWAETSGRGKLVAFTSGAAPSAERFGRDIPYVSGIVELEEGVQISARILSGDARPPRELQIGTPLTAEFIRRPAGAQPAASLAFRP